MKKFWELHKWFCEESRKYVGRADYRKLYEFRLDPNKYSPEYKYSLGQILYFPIAYVKFMYLSLRGI